MASKRVGDARRAAAGSAVETGFDRNTGEEIIQVVDEDPHGDGMVKVPTKHVETLLAHLRRELLEKEMDVKDKKDYIRKQISQSCPCNPDKPLPTIDDWATASGDVYADKEITRREAEVKEYKELVNQAKAIRKDVGEVEMLLPSAADAFLGITASGIAAALPGIVRTLKVAYDEINAFNTNLPKQVKPKEVMVPQDSLVVKASSAGDFQDKLGKFRTFVLNSFTKEATAKLRNEDKSFSVLNGAKTALDELDTTLIEDLFDTTNVGGIGDMLLGGAIGPHPREISLWKPHTILYYDFDFTPLGTTLQYPMVLHQINLMFVFHAAAIAWNVVMTPTLNAAPLVAFMPVPQGGPPAHFIVRIDTGLTTVLQPGQQFAPPIPDFQSFYPEEYNPPAQGITRSFITVRNEVFVGPNLLTPMQLQRQLQRELGKVLGFRLNPGNYYQPVPPVGSAIGAPQLTPPDVNGIMGPTPNATISLQDIANSRGVYSQHLNNFNNGAPVPQPTLTVKPNSSQAPQAFPVRIVER